MTSFGVLGRLAVLIMVLVIAVLDFMLDLFLVFFFVLCALRDTVNFITEGWLSTGSATTGVTRAREIGVGGGHCGAF